MKPSKRFAGRMACTELSVRWEDHHETQATVFKSFLDDNCLVDCTLAAEGRYLKAHKLVLSACSPYFQVLFSQENEKNPIVILRDTKFRELKAVVEFMYCGQVMISEDRLTEFLDIARSLQIKGLNGAPGSKTGKSKQQDSNTTQEKCKSSEKGLPSNHSSSYEENTYDHGQDIGHCNQSKNLDDSSQNQSFQLDVANSSPVPQSSHTSAFKSSTCPGSIENDPTSFQTASSCTVPQQDFISHEDVTSFLQTVIKKEPSEVMHFEPKMECSDRTAHETIGHMSVVNNAGGMGAEIAPVHHEQRRENQFADVCASYDGIPHSSQNNAFLNPQTTSDHSNAQDVPAASEDGRPAGSPLIVFESLGERGQPADDEDKQDATEDSGDKTDGEAECNVQIGKEKRHQCPECPKAFVSSDRLRVHLHRQHLAERAFICNLCQAAFPYNSQLQRHMTKHSGERPYQCGVCNFSFRRSDTLVVHMRKHTGERPYQCQVCKAFFKRSDILNVHMRQHTGERPYQCAVCKASFRQRGTLTVHMRRHTVDKPNRRTGRGWLQRSAQPLQAHGGGCATAPCQ